MKLSSQTRFGSIRTVAIVCGVMMFVGLLETVFGQSNDLFETSSVENRLTKQLRLTSKDIRLIRPLMQWESDDLLSLYGYYSDQGDLDFVSLWDAVRSRRVEFSRLTFRNFTRRQEKALLLARFEFERRILDQWVDDYLQILGELLELDWVQYKYVQRVFDIERRGRLEILRNEANSKVRQDALWKKLFNDRERKMEQILSESQLRSYRQIITTPRLIAMDHHTNINR